jgi:hypothetical protein
VVAVSTVNLEQQSSADLDITGIRRDSMSMNFGNRFAMRGATALEDCGIVMIVDGSDIGDHPSQ